MRLCSRESECVCLSKLRAYGETESERAVTDNEDKTLSSTFLVATIVRTSNTSEAASSTKKVFMLNFLIHISNQTFFVLKIKPWKRIIFLFRLFLLFMQIFLLGRNIIRDKLSFHEILTDSS